MANTKEVRKQIASIKGTQKITSAMEMVAASKMKKTQDNMLKGRPYSLKIKDVISHMASASSEYPHPFYEERESKKACFIVVSSDKGLCGGLNINLFKQVISKSAELHEQGIESCFALIGTKSSGFFKNVGGHIIGVAEKLGSVFVLVDHGMVVEDVTEFLIRPDLPPTHTYCFDRVSPLGPGANVEEVNVLLDVKIPGEPSVVIPVAHLVMHVRPVGLTFLVPNRAPVIICLKREQVTNSTCLESPDQFLEPKGMAQA